MENYTKLNVTIELDTFYQEFLKSYFKTKKGATFAFPKRHELNQILELGLQKQPKNYKPKDYGQKTFKILIPYISWKDVRTYNYISKRIEIVLRRHIISFFRIIFHEEMNKLATLNLQKKERVEIFIVNYNINPKYYDRLIKDYQRYIVSLRRIKSKKK